MDWDYLDEAFAAAASLFIERALRRVNFQLCVAARNVLTFSRTIWMTVFL